MRHFINDELLALNVMKAAVDPAVAARFKHLARGPLDEARFACADPGWNSDVRWVSGRTEEAFEEFQAAFDQLDVARLVEPYVHVDRQVRMYAGFVVVRSLCTSPSFHLDWLDGRNEAFTLITPITENASHFGLIYRQLNGQTAEYKYRDGEALIFGSNFLHSTAPGKSDEPVGLLSFTFGTDRMEYWEGLEPTAAHQGPLYRRPDGLLCRNPRYV